MQKGSEFVGLHNSIVLRLLIRFQSEAKRPTDVGFESQTDKGAGRVVYFLMCELIPEGSDGKCGIEES
jgi:hypothetical protein